MIKMKKDFMQGKTCFLIEINGRRAESVKLDHYGIEIQEDQGTPNGLEHES